jgi:stress response protein YsnF
VPATGDYDNTTAFQEQEIDVPLTREEAVVGKESRATEQVRLNKTVSTETENVGGDVRREDVVEDSGTGTGFAGRGIDGTTTRDSSY